ncbi:MAG: hypothetical protein HYS13_08655 [Planctomycetia bacterium]|nr:hypothetical protein [Planctomycetia bacterium]
MTYPHVIRLAGPWQCARLNDDRSETPVGRIALPADWSAIVGADFTGTLRFTRRFHVPTGLEPHERVWLVCDGADARGVVELNGRPLGEIAGYALAAEFDVTELLAETNLLSVDVELPRGAAEELRPGRIGRAGGLIGAVRLEICSPQHVADLVAFVESRRNDAPLLRVRGRIAGQPTDCPLQIIVSQETTDHRVEDLHVGQQFSAAVPLNLTAWTPQSPNLSEIAVELAPSPAAKAPCHAEWLCSLPTAACAVTPAAAQFLLPAVESPDFYDDLDRRGIPVVQRLPSAWAERLAPRLAHHPSIGAFAFSPDDALRLPRDPAAATFLARPWLPLSDVTHLPPLPL